MATITKVRRKSGDAYKAVIRLRGAKPFSKTFRLMKHARACTYLVIPHDEINESRHLVDFERFRVK